MQWNGSTCYVKEVCSNTPFSFFAGALMCDSAEGVKPLSMGRLVQRTLNLIIKNEAEIVERGAKAKLGNRRAVMCGLINLCGLSRIFAEVGNEIGRQ